MSKANKVLLQEGRHHGTITEANFDQAKKEVTIGVDFGNSIFLQYALSVGRQKDSWEDLRKAVRLPQLSDTNQLIGQSCLFEIELLIVESRKNKFGVNVITGN